MARAGTLAGRGRPRTAVSAAVGLAAAALVVGCGSADDRALRGSAAGGTGAGGPGGAAAGGAAGEAGTAAAPSSGGSAGAPAAGAGGASGATAQDPLDPELRGPHALDTFEKDVEGTSGSVLPTRCRVPTAGPASPPYPGVLVAHGFQLPASQYFGAVEHLASFGYVACTVDYPAGFMPNHRRSAQDLVDAVEWLVMAARASGSPLQGRVDPERIGLAGHSLGGKVSVLAAALQPKVRAVVGLDPVDSSLFCAPADCPDASESLPLAIPMAFLGETTDAVAGFGGQACAPAADNYQTFFERSAPPSIEITLAGANHMSFIDDPAACGVVCSFCRPATAPHGELASIVRAYLVAFFERHLRGDAAYDAYLTGAAAQTRWVGPGRVALRVK